MSVISEKVIQACTVYKDKPVFTYAQDEGFTHINYETYLRAVQTLAEKLVSLNIKPGDRVMLLASYGPEWCTAYMGIHFAGATVIPMDAQYVADEVRTIYNFTKPAAILCDKAHKEIIPAETGTSILIDGVFNDLPDTSDFEPVSLPEDTPMSIIFTSGTTGDPKGVMLSESNFLSNTDFLQNYKRLLSEKDVMLSILPLHHVYGFTCTFLTPLMLGATVVFPRTISGADIAEAVQTQKVTILIAVPQILALFHKKIFETVEANPFLVRDIFRTMKDITRWMRKISPVNPGKILFKKIHTKFPALRFITSGGARLEPHILTDMHDIGFNIIEAYGLTETSPIACFNDPRNPIPGSVGRAITDVEVKIEKTEGNFDQGEICIKGPNVMMGYYNREKDTAKAITDNWFHSGDLGYMDRKGNVFITGRKKEIIILPNGKNIYPEELEKQYGDSERIAEVCVLAYGDTGKEQLTAAVYPNMNYFKEKKSGNIHEEVKYDIETIAVHLPSYQRVTRVELVDVEFPRTRLGKLQRFKIRNLLEKRDASKAPSVKETSTDDPFLQFLMSELDLDFVPLSEHNLETDLGLDSLNKLELFAAVQKRYDLTIGEEKASEIISVQNLIEIVGDAAGKGSSSRFSLLDEIRKDPETPIEKHVAVGWGFFSGIIRFIIHFTIWLFLKIFMRAKIKGIEKLPKKGPFIIAGNHISYFDPPTIYGMLPYRLTRRIFSMSLPEIFENFLLNILRKPVRIIMTGTQDTMIESLRYSRIVLKSGESMIIFPEGKRSVDGKVDKPKNGVFMLAQECNAPLVPVYLKGFTKLYSRLNPGFHFAKLEVEILDPIPVGDNIEEAMDRWFSVMKKKNEEEYDGLSAENNK